jgi:hypothetical protein
MKNLISVCMDCKHVIGSNGEPVDIIVNDPAALAPLMVSHGLCNADRAVRMIELEAFRAERRKAGGSGKPPESV